MPDPLVYLIRHGPVRHPVDAQGRTLVYGLEAKLTEDGMRRCEQLAQAIMNAEGSPLNVFIASPLPRAVQTAEILARQMGDPPVLLDDRLRDTRSAWEGTSIDEFLQVFRAGKVFEDPRTLETFEVLADRMQVVFEDITARFTGNKVAIVSHGDPLRALWQRLFVHREQPLSYLDLVNRFSLQPAQALRLVWSAQQHWQMGSVLGVG